MERISIEESPEFAAFEAEAAEHEAAEHEANVAAYLAYKDEGYPFNFEDFMNGVTI